MGEIAEMMIEGAMCPCGCFIEDGDEPGFMRYCSKQCERDYGPGDISLTRKERSAANSKPRVNCPVCKRRVKASGLSDHVRDVHPETRA